jgi:hypothetical protein
VHAIVPEVFPGLANSGTSRPSAPDCIDFDIDPLFDYLARRRLRPWWLPFAPPSSRRLLERPRLPVLLLTLGNLDSSTSTMATLRMASSTTAIHPHLGFIDINTKGYHPHEFLTGFLSSRSVCTTPTFQLRGDVSPSALAYGFFSSLPSVALPL